MPGATASTKTSCPPAVGTTAVVRGRLMELLAAELLPPEECDNAFVVGVFSLLDVMLGVPLEKALESVALPQPVTDALLHGTGVFAPFLELTRACESGDEAAFAKAAESCTCPTARSTGRTCKPSPGRHARRERPRSEGKKKKQLSAARPPRVSWP